MRVAPYSDFSLRLSTATAKRSEGNTSSGCRTPNEGGYALPTTPPSPRAWGPPGVHHFHTSWHTGHDCPCWSPRYLVFTDTWGFRAFQGGGVVRNERNRSCPAVWSFSLHPHRRVVRRAQRQCVCHSCCWTPRYLWIPGGLGIESWRVYERQTELTLLSFDEPAAP